MKRKVKGSIHLAWNGTICVYPETEWGKVVRYYGGSRLDSIPVHGGGTFKCHCLLSRRYRYTSHNSYNAKDET